MLIEKLKQYSPYNDQEKFDKEVMIEFIEKNPNCLTRENKVGHFTASSWVVNNKRDKVLMIYHNIYKSWAWTGGHSDGIENLQEVALREVTEETGINNLKLLEDGIFSIESLPVTAHVKKGKYVGAHIHFNVTYLIEADENEELVVCQDENSGVKWIAIEDVMQLSKEEHMKVVYAKIIDKMEKNM